LFHKILFQTPELLIDQIVGLMDQADGDVGDDLGRATLDKLAVQLVGLLRLATELASTSGRTAARVPAFDLMFTTS
jgi:hypothetical protein